MYVGIPLATSSFRRSLSVPYQLKFGVLCPILARCTLADKKKKKKEFD